MCSTAYDKFSLRGDKLSFYNLFTEHIPIANKLCKIVTICEI